MFSDMLRLSPTRREWVHEHWSQLGKGSSSSKLRLFGLRDLKYIVTQGYWDVFDKACFLFYLCLELSIDCRDSCLT
jgi:hypothetical protein